MWEREREEEVYIVCGKEREKRRCMWERGRDEGGVCGREWEEEVYVGEREKDKEK